VRLTTFDGCAVFPFATDAIMQQGWRMYQPRVEKLRTECLVVCLYARGLGQRAKKLTNVSVSYRNGTIGISVCL